MQYDFSLLANGGQVLDVRGKFFKYKSGIDQIRVRTSKGGYVDLLPGQGVWNTDYTSLIISDRSGNANSGIILAGDFDFHDDRISGNVSIIDSSKSRTLANQAYIGLVIAPAAGAGLYSYNQLNNPAGSGKNLVVEQIIVASTVNTGFVLYKGFAAGPTAAGNGIAKLLSATAAAPASNFKYGSYATLPGGVANMMLINAAVNTSGLWRPLEPIVITPGNCLTIAGQAANADITTNYEWFEESI